MVEDREVWHAAVHGLVKSQAQLSDCTTKTSGKSISFSVSQFPDDCNSDPHGAVVGMKEATQVKHTV